MPYTVYMYFIYLLHRNSIVSTSTVFANCWKWSGRTKCPTQRFSSRQECSASSPCSASPNSAGLDMSPGFLKNDYPSALSTENCRLDCVVMEARRNASRTHSKPPWRTLEWITTCGRHLHSISQHGPVQSTKEQKRTSNNASRLPRSSKQTGRPVASTLQYRNVLRCPAPSLCQNFPCSGWPHQPPSNPPSPIGWTISEDGHLSPREYISRSWNCHWHENHAWHGQCCILLYCFVG